jgi:hypothetical protein
MAVDSGDATFFGTGARLSNLPSAIYRPAIIICSNSRARRNNRHAVKRVTSLSL